MSDESAAFVWGINAQNYIIVVFLLFEKKPNTLKKARLSKSVFKKAKLATLRLTRMNNPATARRSGDVFFSFPIGCLYNVIAASDLVLALA